MEYLINVANIFYLSAYLIELEGILLARVRRAYA